VKDAIIVIRAVGTEFARRLFLPAALIVLGVAIVSIVTMIWLLTISAWWLLLAVPVFLLVVVSVILLAVTSVVIQTVAPQQTARQRSEVKRFVDKLQTLSDVIQTPKFILLFRIVKDIVLPSQNGFIQSTSGDTLSLKKDFQALQRSFNQTVIEQ